MTACVHHYVMPPYGETVLGECKKCGAQREFSNVPVEASEMLAAVRAKGRGKAISLEGRDTRGAVMPL